MSTSWQATVQSSVPQVNRMLQGATPIGAYAMGMVCTKYWQQTPPQEVPQAALNQAHDCESVEEAIELLAALDKPTGRDEVGGLASAR